MRIDAGDTMVMHPNGQAELSTPWKQIANLIYPPQIGNDVSPATIMTTPSQVTANGYRPIPCGLSPFTPDVALDDVDIAGPIVQESSLCHVKDTTNSLDSTIKEDTRHSGPLKSKKVG